MLKGVDVLVLLKIVATDDGAWTQLSIAKELRISSQTVNAALAGMAEARLYSPARRAVLKGALADFLICGARHFLPARLGEPTRGLPTATAAPPLLGKIPVREDFAPVWPWAEGQTRGLAVPPLHPNVPGTVAADPALYALLAVLDSLRIGDARERGLAAEAMRGLLA